MKEAFAVITFPNYPGSITKKGLGKAAVAFYGVSEQAPIRTNDKWWTDWCSVTVDGHWYGPVPPKKGGTE